MKPKKYSLLLVAAIFFATMFSTSAFAAKDRDRNRDRNRDRHKHHHDHDYSVASDLDARFRVKAKIYDAPSTNACVIESIKANTHVRALSMHRRGTWVYVATDDGTEGYVQKSKVALYARPTDFDEIVYLCVEKSAKLYRDPATKKVYKTLKRGAELRAIGETGKYYKVLFGKDDIVLFVAKKDVIHTDHHNNRPSEPPRTFYPIPTPKYYHGGHYQGHNHRWDRDHAHGRDRDRDWTHNHRDHDHGRFDRY